VDPDAEKIQERYVGSSGVSSSSRATVVNMWSGFDRTDEDEEQKLQTSNTRVRQTSFFHCPRGDSIVNILCSRVKKMFSRENVKRHNRQMTVYRVQKPKKNVGNKMGVVNLNALLFDICLITSVKFIIHKIVIYLTNSCVNWPFFGTYL
jgi:hypothetical protein